jgi:hypothetical protein
LELLEDKNFLGWPIVATERGSKASANVAPQQQLLFPSKTQTAAEAAVFAGAGLPPR